MHKMESPANIVGLPVPSSINPADPHAPTVMRRKRLLDVAEVAEWLGVSKGWVRDHASGRRQPRLLAIKFGPPRGKGLWKFREEDVFEFIREQRHR